MLLIVNCLLQINETLYGWLHNESHFISSDNNDPSDFEPQSSPIDEKVAEVVELKSVEVLSSTALRGNGEVTTTMNDMMVDTNEKSDDGSVMEIEGITGTFSVPKDAYALAKQYTLDKYKSLMDEADTRLLAAEWRTKQAETLEDRKHQLRLLAETDETLLHFPLHSLQLAEPGGTSTLSLTHGQDGDQVNDVRQTDDEPQYSVKMSQDPGGDSTLSLGHEEHTRGVSHEHPTRIKQLQDPGGTSTLSLTHGQDGDQVNDVRQTDDEPQYSVKMSQDPGGDSTLSLGHEEHTGGVSHESPTRIKQLQDPGGTSTLSLTHGQDGDQVNDVRQTDDEPQYSVIMSQDPGGDSTLSLGHEEHTGGVSHESPTRIKQLQDPGGTSTLSLTHGQDGDQVDDVRQTDDEPQYSVKMSQDPGGDSTLSLGHEEHTGGVSHESPTRIKQLQDPGGTSTLSLTHGQDGDQVNDVRQTDDEPQYSVKMSQDPGGDSTLSLGHEEHTGGVSHEHPTRIKQLQDPGGTSTLSLTHGQDGDQVNDVRQTDDEPQYSVKMSQDPGGDSTLSLGHEEHTGGVSHEHPTRIKQLQDPGGTSTLSLTHGQDGDQVNDVRQTDDEPQYSVKMSQDPGGDSTLSLGHEEHTGGVSHEHPTRIKQLQDPGGTSTLSLTHGQDGDQCHDVQGSAELFEDESVISAITGCNDSRVEGNASAERDSDDGVDGNNDDRSEVLLDSGESNDNGDCSLWVNESPIIDGVRIMNLLSSSESFLCNFNSSFVKVLNLMCSRNNIVAAPDACDKNDHENCVHDNIWTSCELRSSYLTPLSFVVQNNLCKTILQQCIAIDHSFLLIALREQNLLAHFDFLQSIFLLSSDSDFLVVLAGVLVDNHIQNNSTMRFISDVKQGPDEDIESDLKPRPRLDFNLYSSHSMALAYKRAQSMALLSNVSFFAHTHINILETTEVDSIVNIDDHLDLMKMNARERHFFGAFSRRGLDGLTLSYEAPWPFNLILTEEYFSIISVVTQRLLTLAQLTALSRHVWGKLRCLRLRSRRSNPKNQSHHRHTHAAFCLVRQTIQAVSNFTSDRLHLLHSDFKSNVARPLELGEDSLRNQGFGKLAQISRSYIRLQTVFRCYICCLWSDSMRIRNVFNSVLVPVPSSSVRKNMHSKISDSIDFLLDTCCRSLFALHSILDTLLNESSDELDGN